MIKRSCRCAKKYYQEFGEFWEFANLSNEQWQACLDFAMTKSKSAKLIIGIFCLADGFYYFSRKKRNKRIFKKNNQKNINK